MYIKSLTTYQFRNLLDQTISCCRGVNLIRGRNAQGKTNLIEAIGLLSLLKSFRTRRTEELISWGKEAAAVFADVEDNGYTTRLGVSLSAQGRRALINENPTSNVRDFLGKLITVTFSPRDLALVKAGPQERRRFIDKHLVDLSTSYLDDLLSYQRALKSKNILLKEGQTSDRALDAWDQVLAPLIARILKQRREFIEELKVLAQETYLTFSQEDGEVDVELDVQRGNVGRVEYDPAEIIQILGLCRKKELLYRAAMFGPHLDDLKITFSGHPARQFASQGQARCLVLALTIAVITLIEKKLTTAPVVLLDDVDSELDRSRSEAFFNILLQQERQVFITGTERAFTSSLVKEKTVQSLLIEKGVLIHQ